MKKCNQCGREYSDDLGFCPQDGQPLTTMSSAGRASSGLAILSLVFGILCFVLCPFAFFIAIPAIICGHIALSRSKKQPHLSSGGGMATAGLILGYIGLFLGLLMPGFFPALAKAKARAQQIKCVNNLKQIGIATFVWSGDNSDRLPNNFLEMSNELANPALLICPADMNHKLSYPPGQYPGSASPIWSPTSISYQLVTPGISRSNVLNIVIVRCPIHGNELYGDGTVKQGKWQSSR